MNSGLSTKTQLSPSFASTLPVPFTRKAGANSSPGESVKMILEANIYERLSRVAPDPEPVLLAAWQTLLSRFSQQPEVTVVLASDSSRLLALTTKFSPGMLFSDVVQSVMRSKARAETENPATAGFNIGYCFERTTGSSVVSRCDFQLSLRIQADSPSWTAELLYDPAFLDRSSIERMGRSYLALLSAVAQNANSAADDLPLLSPEDYQQVVVSFNQSKVPYPDKCVHELFEEQVEKTPDNLALRFQDQVFTYRQLNDRTNQLAHYLRRQGVGPNVPVALFVERSAEMIIGLLAILKAGGCYVPLLHDEPEARLAYLLGEIKAPVILTTGKLKSRLPEFGAEVVLFDDSRASEPAANLANKTRTSDLVCIIYTSGSTGVPKGVAARHSNLANYCQFIRERLGHPQAWHFATVSTIGAILGNTSVFGALMSGGCLHVIDYETGMSPNLFADYFAKHPIDVIKITPSQLGALLAGSEGRCVLPRKYLVVGGEKFTFELLRHIRESGSCRVMNHFGPTETMGCCTFDVDGYEFSRWNPASVPLGRPMSNQHLYIVDRNLRPVPIGVPGELCMSGAGLTDGYFNQPEQTVEKFVANPFEPGARLYRTGDQARFLPDGNIEFLGRIDHQLKIRGFRVEPEEVEAAIKKHRDVRQVVIVPEDGPSEEKVLAAYLVPKQHLDGAKLRTFLREQLPEYMVPSRLLVLPTLPLNRNGKIDLPALAALAAPVAEPESQAAMAKNPTEDKLAKIWAEVLHRDVVGVKDDFFELGGHSLLAMQIISRIRNEFRVQFPLFAFLESPTVADMAAKMDELPRVETEEEETARLLRELEGISDQEAERLLAADTEGGEAAESAPE